MQNNHEQIIVSWVKKQIKLGQSDRLPTIREIARILELRNETVGLVLRKLRTEGVLYFSKGHSIKIAKSKFAKQPSIVQSSGVKIAYDFLFSNITNGIYKKGDVLPKRFVLRIECGVSDRSLGIALKQCLSENLIHKKGKHWIVGPSWGTSNQPIHNHIILIIQPKDYYWSSLSNSRSSCFVSSFSEQAFIHKCTLVPCNIHSKTTSPAILYCGIDKILSFVNNAGSRYQGTLVVGQPEEASELFDLINYLLSFKKPVVWFDRKEIISCPFHKRTNFFHAHFSEKRIAAAAITQLVTYGHKNAGFVTYLPAVPGVALNSWILERIKLLKSTYKQYDGSIITIIDCIHDLLASPNESIAVRFQEIDNVKTGVPWKIVNYIKQQFLSQKASYTFDEYLYCAEKFKSLVEKCLHSEAVGEFFSMLIEPFVILLHPGIKTIIFSNDQSAQTMLFHLKKIAIDISKEYSLLSFDNVLDFTLLPIDSVDIGGTNLGYRVFHAIMGDIPIEKNSNHEIIAECSAIIRGSMKYA